ncbi:phage regulatory CII family protein [Maridesulfovibrio zosterae]|uniref:phage regulatory CII family protein n=1 Tax=Maridesulfovibrio zosterae TaxID=82171 RepID=UPI00040D4660|nr:phage regulatory CII family protein [Maridesulfovibrio zosterae]
MKLTDTVRKMVIDSDIGAREVAAIVDKKYHVLMNELNSENTSHKLGAELLVPLMKACSSDSPMQLLAADMRGLFIKIPDGNGSNASLIKAVKEFGELIAVYGETIERGNLNDNDKKRIRKEGQEAMTAIQELLCGLDTNGSFKPHN